MIWLMEWHSKIWNLLVENFAEFQSKKGSVFVFALKLSKFSSKVLIVNESFSCTNLVQTKEAGIRQNFELHRNIGVAIESKTTR